MDKILKFAHTMNSSYKSQNIDFYNKFSGTVETYNKIEIKCNHIILNINNIDDFINIFETMISIFNIDTKYFIDCSYDAKYKYYEIYRIIFQSMDEHKFKCFIPDKNCNLSEYIKDKYMIEINWKHQTHIKEVDECYDFKVFMKNRDKIMKKCFPNFPQFIKKIRFGSDYELIKRRVNEDNFIELYKALQSVDL